MGRGKHDGVLIEHRNKAVAAWVDRYLRESGMTKVQLAQMAGMIVGMDELRAKIRASRSGHAS